MNFTKEYKGNLKLEINIQRQFRLLRRPCQIRKDIQNKALRTPRRLQTPDSPAGSNTNIQTPEKRTTKVKTDVARHDTVSCAVHLSGTTYGLILRDDTESVSSRNHTYSNNRRNLELCDISLKLREKTQKNPKGPSKNAMAPTNPIEN